jgi:hypothetical protein
MLLYYFPYFEETRGGLWHHPCVCVPLDLYAVHIVTKESGYQPISLHLTPVHKPAEARPPLYVPHTKRSLPQPQLANQAKCCDAAPARHSAKCYDAAPARHSAKCYDAAPAVSNENTNAQSILPPRTQHCTVCQCFRGTPEDSYRITQHYVPEGIAGCSHCCRSLKYVQKK